MLPNALKVTLTRYFTTGWLSTRHKIEKEIKRNFVMGGHKILSAQSIAKPQNHPSQHIARLLCYKHFKLKTARAVNDALNEAFNIVGKAARVWTISHGNYLLPKSNHLQINQHHQAIVTGKT